MSTVSEILDNESTAHAELTKLGYSDSARALEELKILRTRVLGKSGAIINELSNFALSTPAPETALARLNEVTSTVDEDRLEALLSTEDNRGLRDLMTILGSSPYLSGILIKNIELLDDFFIEDGLVNKNLYEDSSPLVSIIKESDTKETVLATLRHFRSREYLRIGARDLLGYADMATITSELSALARTSLEAAYDFTLKNLKAKHGEPVYIDGNGIEREALFSVIALGKLGGGELNFLSDIDILYLCSTNDGETRGIEGKVHSKTDLHTFFGRLAKEITTLIGSVTEDGFVFRVDLDLRPDGKSGPVVNSIASLETYYHSWGRPWERSAMIKATHAGGAKEVSEEFLELIEPFVYRRNLDFSAIEEIKAMKEGIDLARKKADKTAINVKLGKGGIREIEFFLQALQIIYGGRDRTLRVSSTLSAIERLRSSDKLLEKDALLLKESYVFLRNLEHRIQMVDGQQTQTLPEGQGEINHIAKTMGIENDTPSNEFFWQRYNEVTSNVHEIYRSLFYNSTDELKEEIPSEIRELLQGEEVLTVEEASTRATSLGFSAVDGEVILAFAKEPTGVRLTPKTIAILDKLKPFMVAKALLTTDPARAMRGAVRFVSTIGARSGLYALMSENPPFVEEVMKIFAESEFLTSLLVERPENIDILLTREASQLRRSETEVAEELTGLLLQSRHFEESLDILRRFKSQELFRIGTGDIAGTIEAKDVARELTALAEVLLRAALKVSLREVELKYKTPKGSSFYIIGLGGLGAFEVLYGSDLDIIFVYSEDEEISDTSAHEFYVTLAQKIISTLSTKTSAGQVYEIDTRLRPSGSAGPLVVSKRSLIEYHKKEGQVWERLAMMKARVVASTEAKGDLSNISSDGKEGEKIIRALQEVVYSKGFTKADGEEMIVLRARMEDEIAKEEAGDINIKVGRGGLTDIDFIIQTLQLRFGGSNTSLRTTETIKSLKGLREVGALSDDDFKLLKEAYLFYRLLEVKLRIVENISEGTIRANSEELRILLRKVNPKEEEGTPTAPKAKLTAKAKFTERCERYRLSVRDIYLKTLSVKK
ncbi:MAG: bifunctional [glutamate--ammonia ligase]-adenylyl-L-tyrosine phosphorylase/[glutamate--ammonia-ligase] adenylyltransferase [Deltaproteobacteria bacterium]|nr:bifunctional [glutamate--ammonia ligase]-adenylyl-L-tyrosine phosphorylase/[glutamate--ammonia-ligase] adenylyltransferase [Deltaproteobacteria bacterium]